MFDKGAMPVVPTGLISGEVSGYNYFFNPLGHKGVVVLFGDALDVFNLCLKGYSFGDMLGFLPWASNNNERFWKIVNGLGNMELIGLGEDFDRVLRLKRRESAKKTMTVWLQLTDACNLRCEYCCISKKPTRMGLNMAMKLVDKIVVDAGKAGFEEVFVKIAGGEPTLFWQDAKALIDWAEPRFAASKPAVRFHIISNGTLIASSLIDYLKREKVGLSISLDGVGKWHDSQRPFVSGCGSFEKVDSNISKLVKEGISFNILAVVTGKSAGGLTELAQYCISRDLPFRFGFYREKPSSICESEVENEDLIRELKRCYSWMADNLPDRNLQSFHKLGDVKLDGPKIRNCGIGANSLTVGCDGSLSICQYEMEVSLGNVLECDSVETMRGQKVYDLDSTNVNKVPVCKDCEWKYNCGGGCPLLTKQHFGSMGHAFPYCSVYKAVLPVLVELFALQMVRKFENARK